MKKLIALALAAMLLCGLFAGCINDGTVEAQDPTPSADGTSDTTTGGGESSTSAGNDGDFDPDFDVAGLKVGVAFYAYASASAIRQLDYLIYVFEQAGCEVVYAIANGVVEQQLTDVENLLEQGVDVMILNPTQEDGYESTIRSCRDAGVPLFVMGNNLNNDVYTAGEDYVTLLQADQVLQGYDVGRVTSDIAQNEIGGTAYIVELFGTPGMASSTNRVNGFQNWVNETDDIVILGMQSAYNRTADAQSIVENYLMSSGGPGEEGGVNVIVCMTHNCAVGAVAAVRNMGYQLNEEVYVVVVDGVKEDLQAILDGEMYAAVESPVFYAEQQLELIERYFRGEQLDGYYEIEPHLFTRENAQEWYDKFNAYDELIGLED